MPASRGKMVVEMRVEEMGCISIALDYFLSNGGPIRDNPTEWADVRDRWDVLYKSTHRCLDLGLRRLDGS
jgi:hypothetical protein